MLVVVLAVDAEHVLEMPSVQDQLGPGCYVNLMAQYYPSGKVGRDGEYAELDRHLHREEYEQTLAWALELGLRLDPRSVGERRSLARAG